MELMEFLSKKKMDAVAFVLNFFPEKQQIKTSIKIADRIIRKTIQKESEWVGEYSTSNAEIYWSAYKETMWLLYFMGEKKKLNQAYALLGKMMDEMEFNKYLFDISELIHNNHPRYMTYKYELHNRMVLEAING